jgi:hypothetical protein
MQPHLSNLQFLFAVVALVLVAVLALATVLDIRRRRRIPPFLNYFYSDFDPDQYDRERPYRDSFTGLSEWRAYHRGRLETSEVRGTTSHI